MYIFIYFAARYIRDVRLFGSQAREDAERRAAEGLSGPVSQQRGAATKRPDGSVIHPVVLVPGICGSALWAHPGSAKPWRAWVVLEHSDQEFRHLLGRFDPSSGIFLPLRPDQPTASSDDRLSRPSWIPGFGRTSGPSPTEAPKIVAGVPGDDTGLQGVEVLDPDMLLPVEAVRYYRLMSLHLQQLGYVPGVTLWGAPYDFRQSNRAHATLVSAMRQSSALTTGHVAHPLRVSTILSCHTLRARLPAPSQDSLEARLERAFEAGGRVPVDIVSHSMGGLVVKSLLALRPQVFERLVRKWVTIGTPFQVSEVLPAGGRSPRGPQADPRPLLPDARALL